MPLQVVHFPVPRSEELTAEAAIERFPLDDEDIEHLRVLGSNGKRSAESAGLAVGAAALDFGK